MSNVQNKRYKPSGRGKTGISAGRVMDEMLKRLEATAGFRKDSSAAYRLDLAKSGYVPRAFLPLGCVMPALEQAGVTMDELFEESDCKTRLEAEDEMMMSLICNAEEKVQLQILGLVRECQEPWWVPLLDGTPVSTARRLQIIARRRVGSHDNREELACDYPILAGYEPFSKVFFVETDELPALARELDVHVASLTELGCTVPWYSTCPTADRVFAEYRMLSRPNRSIVCGYAQQITGGGAR